MFRQIHLTYRLQQIIQCGATFKILYNNPLTQTLLFKDGKHIIEYNYGIQSITAKVSINIQETKLAIHACYDEKYELYFILCEGWKLNIYRKNLKILQTIHFDSKYNIGMVYNDGYMLLVGVEGINIQNKEIDLYEVKIQCDERLLKFLSNIKITINQTKGRTRLDSGIEWIAGFAVIKEEFIFWGNKEFVIMTQNGIKHRCQKISNKDKVISKIIFSQLFMYYIIGYENGQIKIWRIGKKTELLIHTFDGHVKQVTELIEHRDKRLYWSSSPDMTLRLWNMEQFCNLYTITLSGFYSNLTLLTKDRFLVEQDHDVLLGFMNPNINLLYSVQSKVIGSIKHENNLTLLLENHSAVLISGSDLEGNDLTKLPINQIFLPYKFIRDIQQALVRQPLYIILIDGGDLLLYRQDKNWQNIELQSEQIRDFNGNKMLQQIVCIQFSNLNIPCYDADFGQKSTFKRSDQLILGMSRGSIIFIQLHDPHQMYARMSYHREKIISLAEIDNVLISFCEEGFLKLSSYQDGKIFCLKSFNSFKKIHKMLMFDNKAVFIQEKGPFQIFKYKNQQLRLFSYDKGNDHDSKVLSVDYLGDRKLYITAADDQKIKVWSSRKILLIQILLYDEINCAYILSGGLIIAHSGKISTIKQNFVKLHSIQPKQVNKDNKELVGQHFEEFYQDEKALVIKQKIEQINIISNTPLQKKSVKLKQPNSLYAGGKIINENDKQVIIYRLPNDTHRPKSKSQNVSAKRDRTVESDSRVLPSIFQNLNKEKQRIQQQTDMNTPIKLVLPDFGKQRQLQQLTQMRQRAEDLQYNGSSLQGAIKHLNLSEGQKKVEYNPIQSTLGEIDRLKTDYLNAGYRDRLYLDNLDRLKDQYIQQVQPNNFYVRSHHRPHHNDRFSSHPIYQYLPDSFKSELQDKEKGQSLPKIHFKTESLDSDSKNQKILNYMKNEEISELTKSNYSFDRFNKIQYIRGKVENALIRDKVNQIVNTNIDYKYEEEQHANYSSLEGFIIRWDFVSQLPISIIQARIAYGFYKQDEEFHPYKFTLDQIAQQETFRSNKVLLQQRELIRDITEDKVLYLEVWGYDHEFEPKIMGWSILKLFDELNYLVVGKFKLPLYPAGFKPNALLEGEAYPYVGNTSVYLRILQTNNTNDDLVFIDSDYRIQQFHIHKEAKIIKPIEKRPSIPDPIILKEPLRVREPQLFEDLTTRETVREPSIILKQKNKLSRFSRGDVIITEEDEQPKEKEKTTKNHDIGDQTNTTRMSRFTLRNQTRVHHKRKLKKDETPKTFKSNSPQGQQIPSQPTPKNQSTPRQHTSPHQTPKGASVSGSVVLKVNKLGNFDQQKIQNLKIKIGFFIDQYIIKDVQENECVIIQNLIPIDSNQQQQMFDFYSEFEIDYPALFQMFSSNAHKAFIYFAFYHSNQTLFGWFMIELFKESDSYFQINSGIYKVNLLDPPGQQAPFDSRKMIKNNMLLEFSLFSKTEKQGDLDHVNLYHLQEVVKVKQVKNPLWNTQISIALIQAINFPGKDDISVKIAIVQDQTIIEDVLERSCVYSFDLDLFSSDSSSIYNSTLLVTFRCGKLYLIDNFIPVSLLNYVFTFSKKDAVIGLCTFPVFKKGELQKGQIKAELYDVNNKKTKMQIILIFKEQPLQLDQIEATPGMRLDKKLGGYTKLQTEDNTPGTVKQQKQYYPVTITLHTVQLPDCKFKIYISKGNLILLDSNKEQCSTELQKPGQVVWLLPLDQMIQEGSSDHYQLIIELLQGDVSVGWLAVNLIQMKRLYETRLQTELFRPPVLMTPVDFRQVKKLRAKIDIQIEHGDVARDKRKKMSMRVNKKLVTNLMIHYFNAIPDGDYQLLIQLRTNEQILQDKLTHPCEIKQEIQIQNQKISDLNYQISITRNEIPQNAYILIQLTKDKKDFRWVKIDIKQGKIEKKLFMPPFQKPPFATSTKNSTIDICVELD